MSNTTHTPGPWTPATENPHCILAPSRTGFAIVATLPRDGTQVESTESNSRLIAAAPDLLSSLERALLELETVIVEVDHRPILRECCRVAARDARAAIAKAKGN